MKRLNCWGGKKDMQTFVDDVLTNEFVPGNVDGTKLHSLLKEFIYKNLCRWMKRLWVKREERNLYKNPKNGLSATSHFPL